MDEAPEQRCGCCSAHPVQEPHFRDTSWEEITQPRDRDTGQMGQAGDSGQLGCTWRGPCETQGRGQPLLLGPSGTQAGLKVAGLVLRGAGQGCTQDPNHP